MKTKLPRTTGLFFATLALAACSAGFAGTWPPPWRGTIDAQGIDAAGVDFSPIAFRAPQASHCRGTPPLRETQAGIGGSGRIFGRPEAPASARDSARSDAGAPAREAAAAAKSEVERPSAEARMSRSDIAELSRARPAAQAAVPQEPRAVHEAARAGMVDDNADFGAYLAYRARHPGLLVREREIGERYPLQVNDAFGRPVHDAEVALQRAGLAEPVAWARTDTAGRVWLHPRAFLPAGDDDGVLGVAVRKHGSQARALLRRGQTNAVQVRLDAAPNPASSRSRLDLVFMIDATGSMADEIAKLKASMQQIAQQIAELPARPELCFALVAYRDRGDAFLTRSLDFTDDLRAFQAELARLQAAGGGDMPEALNEALHEVVHNLAWRADAARMVVLVGDAPPHLDYGGPQYDRDMQAALAKGIKVFAVGASGLDPAGEYVFRQIAQYTAGRFVFLTYKDAARPGRGPGTQTPHDVTGYSVDTLDRLVVRLVGEEMARLVRG